MAKKPITEDVLSLPLGVSHGESDLDRETTFDDSVSRPYFVQRNDARNWTTENCFQSPQAALRSLQGMHQELIEKGWVCHVRDGQMWHYSAGSFEAGWWDSVSIYINKQLAAGLSDLKAEREIEEEKDAPITWV